MKFKLLIQVLFTLLLFFSACEQRYLYRSKVRVPTSKYSNKKELLVPRKPFAIDKPKIQEFKFGRKVLKKEKVPSLKEINRETEPTIVKLFRKKEQVTLSDTIAPNKGYRGRVLLAMSGTALLLGGLVSATPLGFGLAVLGFALLILMIFLWRRELRKGKAQKNEPKTLENHYFEPIEPNTETERNTEKKRFKLGKAMLAPFLIGIWGFALLLGMLFKRDRLENVKNNPKEDPAALENQKLKKPKPRLESKPNGEMVRFILIKVVFYLVLVGLICFMIGFPLAYFFGLYYAVSGLLFFWVFSSFLSPGLAVISYYGRKYAQSKNHYRFYGFSLAIAILGMIGFFTLIFFDLTIDLIPILIALLIALLLWALVRSTLKSRKQLRFKD